LCRFFVTENTQETKMKKILLGLAAVLALGFAAPAFAEGEGGEEKPAKKKGKKGKKGDEAPPAGDAEKK
jgi:hypothetical protein